jgi:hypothetical protein
MLRLDCQDEACISALIVDDVYFEKHEKKERTLFFLSDSDADKTILKNAEFFKETNMELLLGHYFYVKYEDDLAKIFKTMYEPEEYMDLVCSSTRVVTASFQTALEARVAGAEVVFIEINQLSEDKKNLLSLLQIMVMISFNVEDSHKIINQGLIKRVKIAKNNEIIKKIINKL